MNTRASSRLRRVASWLAAAAALLIAQTAQAYPHHGERVTVRQPDGTAVEVILWGDELFARAETIDGYALVLEPGTNRICYAMAGADGELVSTGIPYTGDEDAVVDGQRRMRTRPNVEAELRRHGVTRGLRHGRHHAERQRDTARGHLWGGGRAPWNAPASGSTAAQVTAQSSALLAAAPTGSATGLLVLVDFPDRPATIPQAELETAFNGATYGDPRGSIRTWTEAISYGAVSVNHRVTAYYRARNPTTYYLRGGQGDYTGASELMREVYAYIDANIDLRTLTVIDGALSSLAVVYAGDVVANGWANSLWPHAGGARYTTSEGVRITHYYMSNLGNRVPVSLRTHRHELGHSFFSWPDTYDYDGDSKSAGGFAMETDIPCAPFRMWAGWIDVVDVHGVNQTYSLPANGDTALRYRNPSNTREYFIVENLLKTGWNTGAPDQGLLVWHVDEAGNNSWQDMTPTRHYELSVEQADGLFELERNVRGGADGDLFHAGYRTLFDATTTPNSNWWSGAQSGLRLSGIGAIGSTMTVTVGTGTVPPPTCTQAPPSIAGLTATATSSSAIALSWSAVTPPPNCSVTYSVFRSTTPGFTPSSANQVASGLTATSFSSSGLAASTTYHFLVQAVDAAGTSAAATSATTLPAQAVTAPLTWYRLDETAGTTAADASGNGRTATLLNGATWTAGRIGGAVSLSGSNQYASLPAGVVSTLGDFTIATWVRVSSTASWTRVFDFGRGTSVNMFLTPRAGASPYPVRFAITTGGAGAEQRISGTASLPTGVWKHVAVTLSGNVGILYVDGVEVGRNSGMSLRPSSLGSTTANYLGRSQYADPYLAGQLDDFRIYGRALSAAELQAVMQGQ